MHQTNDLDDGYMGSGKILNYAQEKYGIENFEKEILYIFDNRDDMVSKEGEIVNEEFLDRDDVYNLTCGGKGGWHYANRMGLNLYGYNGKTPNVKDDLKRGLETQKYLWKNDPEWADRRSKQLSENTKQYQQINGNPFSGKSHTDETKRIIGEKNSKYQSGSGNSQYGSIWITNGVENKKIKRGVDTIPEGWYKGRAVKCSNGSSSTRRMRRTEQVKISKTLIFNKLEICDTCIREKKRKEQAYYWWNEFNNSKCTSIRDFVKESSYDKSHVSLTKMFKKYIIEYSPRKGVSYKE